MPYMDATENHSTTVEQIVCKVITPPPDAIGLENFVDDSARPQSSKIIEAGDIGEKPVPHGVDQDRDLPAR